MKIEVELLDIDKDTDKARGCAVLLLGALPHDEAMLAISEWRAVQIVRAEDEAALREAYQKAEEAVAAKATIPPQDVGYSEAPPRTVQVPEHLVVEAPDAEIADLGGTVTRESMRQHPDYKVGGWVITDLDELGRIVGIKTKGGERQVKVEIDAGDQNPTEKYLAIDRVRPASTAEVVGAAAVVAEQPGGGEKKKRGRPKKVAQEPQQPEPNGAAELAGGGEVTAEAAKAAKYEGTSLRDLSRLAEHYVGRDRMFELYKEHGVGKLDGAEPQRLDSLRAAVLELVP